MSTIRVAYHKWSQILRHELQGRRHRQVHYVTDNANWSFKWDAHYISQGLRDGHGLSVRITTAPWALRHQIILFGNRYSWFNGPRETIHPSNTLFLTWFHGDQADANPEMRKMFDQLPGALDRLRRVMVTCTISRNILIAQGVAEAKIVTIPLGVELARFKPPAPDQRLTIREQLGIPRGAFCVGSFQKDGTGWTDGQEPKWVKGPDIFLKTLARLKAIQPNLFVLLTGPARGYVKSGLEAMGIAYRHWFLEDYTQIVACYQALDLYIISSRAEGGPKALLESWACAVPVVSTQVGMPADLIHHGKNGMLASIEAVDELAEHAATLMTNRELRQNCINEGLVTVKNYDWSIIASQYHKALLTD